MRIQRKFFIKDLESFRTKALQWGAGSSHCCYLNGNSHKYAYESFPEILAAGCRKEFASNFGDFEYLESIYETKEWAFGFQGYSTTDLSIKQDSSFPPGIFFIPESLIFFYKNNLITIESIRDPETILQEVNETELFDSDREITGHFTPETSKENYLNSVKGLKGHINKGNIYQANYCTKFKADNVSGNPEAIYTKLNKRSPMPFSGFLKINEYCIISASPERFLKKINKKLISQPMKGTAPTFHDEKRNNESKESLLMSEKERSENIMIVDLVRNDLSRICLEGSVKVENLCQLYSLNNVHQMVSTVVGILSEENISSVFSKTFPMGSMTGAPKISAMNLINEYETSARGPFSGMMGYMDPSGNFDFNVLIRSLFYNTKTGNAFFCAGSGITNLSDPETEFAECLLKAETISKLFSE